MLNERSQKVLCAIVESYINEPLPVGSRLVTKRYPFNLSPATIRNIMADLEDMGFLTQPHASAGRVPTDTGYRVYVDYLCREGTASDGEFYNLWVEHLDAMKSDLNAVLNKVTAALSSISHYLVFAVPRGSAITLNRIQLYRYQGAQTAAVILTNEGVIKNKVIPTDFGLTQRDLNRISDYLNSEFSGMSIAEIHLRIVEQMSKEKAICDILISTAIAVCREALSFPEEEIYMSGLPEFLGIPDFSNRISEIAKAIEDKHAILRLLEGMSSTECLRVVIGSENPFYGMKELSVVIAPYKQGGRPLGCLGVIGPTRMNYSKAIPMVEVAVESISAAISGR